MLQPGELSSGGNGKKCKRRTVVAYFETVYFIIKNNGD